jgi:molybdate transport system substrate-binding protein
MASLSGGETDAQAQCGITVSAAISLKNVFEEVGKGFMAKRAGTKVSFNFGASGDLARQIEAGAPVDVFASAAPKDMDDIDRKGLIAARSRRDFSGNRVVLIRPVHSNSSLLSFYDLQNREVRKMVIGNPRTVPAGRYAEEVLRSLNLWAPVREKLVFAEHVRQALDYVARNEVDAGIVYATDALSRSKEVVTVIQAPEGSHSTILYPIAIIKETKEMETAKAFVEFVLSEEAQQVLRRYGFSLLLP